MANPLHVEWLKEGVERWNARREAARLHAEGLPYEHTGVTQPDESLLTPNLRDAKLNGVDLHGAKLSEADLNGAKLSEADLNGADLNGANLFRTILSEADLNGADLSGANLIGAILIGANLNRAKLREANLIGANLSEAKLNGADLNEAYLRGAVLSSVKRQWPSNDESHWRFTNLAHSFGLTQELLNEAIGDTGVILPEGLVHPDHWPELEDEATEEPEVVEEAIESRPAFVFLSYSHEDREVADQFHPLLLEQDMPIWWDVHILPGQNWAAEIKQHLDDAAAVLVLWTENSVKSSSVVEEARQAQSRGALVHARLDDADLPYGVSETQYADLRNWDGTADHPEMRKLLQALRDKLSPPSSKEIGDRLVSNSSIGTQIDDGKISFVDTPVGVEPPMHNPEEFVSRIIGQIDTIDDLIEQNQAFESNAVPANFEFLINRYKFKLIFYKPNWFNLDNSMEVIKILLSRESYRETWEESLADLCGQLITGHNGLEPFIRPEQLPEDSIEKKPEAPDPIVSRINDIPIDEGAGEFEAIAESAETSAVLDDQASEMLKEQSQELKKNLEEFKNPTDTRDNKGGRLRQSIKTVGKFVAVTMGGIVVGVATNVLTAPEAAKTLMLRLKSIWDWLLKLF